MNKAFRWLCMVTALIVLVTALCLPAFAAGQTVKITVGASPVSASGGSTVSLPVGLEAVGAGSTRITGLSISVSYDKTKLAYVSSPVVSGISELSSTMVYHNEASAVVSLAWSGSSSVSLAAQATLYTMTFRVLSGAAGNTSITVKINELDNATVSGSNITYDNFTISGSNPATKVINISSTSDPMVKAAYDAIEAIGTVTYTPASLAKINEAAYRYSLLSAAQKAMVTNYEKLAAALLRYEQLKDEEAQKPVNDEVSKYIGKHGVILSTAVENVQLTDEAAVNAAYDDFQKLSAAAKNKLFAHNAQLKNMKARIEALKKAEEDREKAEEEERRLRQEAKDNADGFRAANANLLNLKEGDLLPEHYAGLVNAVATINMLSGLNPYVGDLLTAEKFLLDNLLQKVEKLIEETGDGPTAAELAADKYRAANSWLLSQTEKTIAAGDKMDIMIALEVYGVLEPDVQSLLSKEYSLLNKLLAKAAQLESQSSATGTTAAAAPTAPPAGNTTTWNGGGNVTEPWYPTDPTGAEEPGPSDTDYTGDTDGTTEPTGQGAAVTGSDDNNKTASSILGTTSMAVPIALMIFVISFILFESLQAYYHLYYKKKIAEGAAI